MLGLALLISACQSQNKPPENVIEEDVYIDMLAELQLLKSYSQSMTQDSAAVDSLEIEIYDKYGVSRERFQESHQYYNSQYEAQKKRIDEAIERMRMDLVKNDSAATNKK